MISFLMCMKKKEIIEKYIGYKLDKFDENLDIVIDTRKATPNSIFFAINSGNEYIKEAIDKGSFVIHDKYDEIEGKSFKVKDTIKFMQELASIYRKERNFIVIGVTGSNGKTTVKDIIYEVLSKKNTTYKTIGNYNNHIGLPLTILSANDNDKYLILEMGMSNIGEIDLLSNIAKPNYSIITNIGESHLEYLKTKENVFKAKTEIIKHTSGKVFVNSEDEYLSKLKNVIQVKKVEIKTNLLGNHNKINVSLVDALMKELEINDVSYDTIKLTSGRFEIIENKKYRYINDAYNASPKSMKASIETYSSIDNNYFKIICLGDMLELGEEKIKYHEDLLEILEKSKFDVLMLYGENMRYLYNKIRKLHILKLSYNEKILYSVNHYNSKEEIIKDINKIKTDKEKSILLKASRSIKLEEIMEDK